MKKRLLLLAVRAASDVAHAAVLGALVLGAPPYLVLVELRRAEERLTSEVR